MENSHLLDIIDSQILKEGSEEEFAIIGDVAKRCLNPDRKSRPTMKEVLLEIEVVLSFHLPKPNEDIWPKSEQMVTGITRSDGVPSSSSFYLETTCSSSAEVSLLFNSIR
ncbi:Wall-associated receptor kinase-like 2 [Bienertia sinuspersici]